MGITLDGQAYRQNRHANGVHRFAHVFSSFVCESRADILVWNDAARFYSGKRMGTEKTIMQMLIFCGRLCPPRKPEAVSVGILELMGAAG
jgi:hypothetical protein